MVFGHGLASNVMLVCVLAENEEHVVAQLDFSRNTFSQISSAQSENSDPTAGDLLKSQATDATSLHLNNNCATTLYLFVKPDPDTEDGCAVDRSNPQASPKHTSKEIKLRIATLNVMLYLKHPSEPEIHSNECDTKVKVVIDKHDERGPVQTVLSDEGSSHMRPSPDSSPSDPKLWGQVSRRKKDSRLRSVREGLRSGLYSAEPPAHAHRRATLSSAVSAGRAMVTRASYAYTCAHTPGERPYGLAPSALKPSPIAGTCAAHCRVHSGEKPYACSQCEKSYGHQGQLANTSAYAHRRATVHLWHLC